MSQKVRILFIPGEPISTELRRLYHVYILENDQGRLYVGQTGNLHARLRDRNRTDALAGRWTRKNGPWKLVWSEPHPTRPSAMARERQIKSMKSAAWIRLHLLGQT